jgi:DNA polymerase-4
MERHIAHLHIPDFPIQMEARRWPRLRGRPAVIVPALKERAVIQAASREAVAAGVRIGMLLSAAQKACRKIEVLPFDARYYQSGSEAIFAAARSVSPLAESHFGNAYLDLSAIRKSSRVVDLCWTALRRLHTSMHIQAAAGLAGNKLVSAIASRLGAANQLTRIETGREKSFLEPLSVRYLPAVDRATWQTLELMGLTEAGRIARFSSADVATIFGRAGVTLHEQANGIDFTPVVPFKPAQGKVFAGVLCPDTNDIEKLRDRVCMLAERAGAELQNKSLCARRLVLEIEHADIKTARTEIRLRVPSGDEAILKTAALTLLAKAVKRRVSVRLIMLTIVEMTPAVEQLSLFPALQDEKRQQLTTAMHTLKGRFGEHIIGYARAK